MTNQKKDKSQDQVVEIDLLQVASALWKHIIAILLTGIIFGALLFGYARFFKTPQYEANALFYVNNSALSLSSAVAITTGELSAASDLVDTYVAILSSRANMELVIERSGVDYTYEQLRKMIDAKAENSTGLFKVIVTSSNPEEARTLANTIAAILPEKISDIVANSSVEVVDYAVTPHQRVSPSYIKYAAVGLLLGMVLCAGIVILGDLNDTIIHNEDYLHNTYDVPILATIPDLNAKTSKKYGYYGSSDRKGSAA
jgi:capsular polysaccharide biosynthesis protein